MFAPRDMPVVQKPPRIPDRVTGKPLESFNGHSQPGRGRRSSFETSGGVVPMKPYFRPEPWALVFQVIAILAAILGFTGISLLAAGVAKILFLVFLVLFVVSLVAHIARRA
jgi:uncharacterized membrane protein YtjA (UPF0391 family)